MNSQPKEKAMKRGIFFILSAIFLMFSCSTDPQEISRTDEGTDSYVQPQDFPRAEPDASDPSNEDVGWIIPEEDLLSFTAMVAANSERFHKPSWAMPTHQYLVYIAARKLGLPETRAAIMRDAAYLPDIFQAGIDNFYNQQWSHAYIYWATWFGPVWVWGDADDDFHDNLFGPSGELESPEGYNGKWAGYYYTQGNQPLGDWYVGYGCHYIADVSLFLHTTIPDLNLALHHTDYEEWIHENWDQGHGFRTLVEAVSANEFRTFTDAKGAIRWAARNSNLNYNSVARTAWNQYVACGFPRGAGTGNSALVNATAQLLREALKNTGGAIKMTLNHYHQW